LILAVSGRSVLYFANDGGPTARSTDTPASPAETVVSNNQFDSLNQTLVPMTQLFSFSHIQPMPTRCWRARRATDPRNAELVNSGWRNVNSGDGGHSEINPAIQLSGLLQIPE